MRDPNQKTTLRIVKDGSDRVNRAHGRAGPGSSAPVSSPFSSSTVALTITLSMPTASRFTWMPPAGKVVSGSRGLGAIVSGSKIVMSVTLPRKSRGR